MIGVVDADAARRVRASARRLAYRVRSGPVGVDDLEQEGWLGVVEAWGRGADPTGPGLSLVARRAMLRALNRRLAWEADDAAASMRPAPARPVLDGLELLDVRDAVGSLPPRLAETVRLHYVEGRSYAETAAACGVTKKAVDLRLRRTIEALGPRLAPAYDGWGRTIPLRRPDAWKCRARRSGKGGPRPGRVHDPESRRRLVAARLAIIEAAHARLA